jgi:nickel-dependent lactate racemase
MSNGAPIFINKEVYEAQLKIGVGNIVPHHVCGWAGGAKIVLPGISGEETTACMHLFSAQNKKSFLGILENPVRKMMEETSKAINFNIVFNTVLDMQGKIIRTFFGDIVHAFRAGVSFARKIYSVEIPALADIVLVSSSPYDVDFWQAHKTLYSADLAVKDGGTIIVASPCYEGVSKVHPELLKIAHMEPRNIEAKLEAGEIEDKLAAAQSLVWGQIRGRANVILVTEGVSPEEARLMGFEHCCSIEEALELGFQKHGKKAKVTVLTRPDVIPQVF